MPDVFTKAKRSEVMSRIRGRGNKETEIALVRLLRRNKIIGWRRQRLLRVGKLRVDGGKRNTSLSPSPYRGEGMRVRPDFIFPKLKLAVFVDGCFWHCCPKHSSLPANNRDFWRRKLDGNKARDRLVTFTLRKQGWRVLRIWEHELARKNEARLLRRIQRALNLIEQHSLTP